MCSCLTFSMTEFECSGLAVVSRIMP
jgi:hypothetical protein